MSVIEHRGGSRIFGSVETAATSAIFAICPTYFLFILLVLIFEQLPCESSILHTVGHGYLVTKINTQISSRRNRYSYLCIRLLTCTTASSTAPSTASDSPELVNPLNTNTGDSS
jgi:hypothetical protein